MKLSPLIFSIIVFVLVLVDVEGRCRKRIVKYIQPAPISVPPPRFNFQSSLEDNIIARDAGTWNMSPDTAQRPNLSCLLFSDDGCKVSCDLMCDINGCRQSEGFCSQKFYCTCNEIYVVQNQPVTADQFRKLTFDDLWNYKFKPTNNSANLKKRIFQSDELYGFVMPFLQNPHKSGRDVKEALLKRYPKLSSAQNLQPREHGVKAKLFGDGSGAGDENLHRYIQNMMSSMQQNSVYDRLNHTRYMRRIINLIKDIDDKEDLSYILRQIKQTGNDRLLERLRRYLMKRGYYFDNNLRPISKKAGFCMKKKGKCGCKHKLKSKLKRFFYGGGATSFNHNDDDDDDSDWVEAEGEKEQIEAALIEELIDSNNAEAKYPSNTILDEQPTTNTYYPIVPEKEPVPSSQGTTIIIPPPQLEEIVEVIPENTIEFNENQMVPPNDSQYIITTNTGAPEYPTMPSQQPTLFLQKINYPEYGTFFGNPNKNQVPNKPIPEFSTDSFANYGNQQIPSPSMTPETIYYEEFAQPEIAPIQNIPYPSNSFENSQYFDTPDSTVFTIYQNQGNPSGSTAVYQYPELFDEPMITPAQKLNEYQKSTIVSQNPEKSSESIIIPPKLTSPNLEQLPQTVVTQPQIVEGPSKLPVTSQSIEQIPQPINTATQDLKPSSMPLATPQTTQQILQSTTAPIQVLQNPLKPPIPSQHLDNLAPKIPQNLTSPPKSVPSSETIQKSSQKIPSPPQNLLQQFVTEKPSPKIPDSSPYIDKLSPSVDVNTFDIPDAVPSMESLFVKHNQKPDKISTTNISSPALSSSSTSFSSSPKSPSITNNPELYDIQTQSTKIPEPETQSPMILKPYEIQSQPVIQKPKDKVYYQVLMDENGNIIKSANYKYPGQPQYSQNMQQSVPASPPQYSSMTHQEDQPLFDKFNKQKILDAAKSKPGQSMVLDYDLNTTDDIPIFDIPSDIDMLSGTFGVSPEGLVVEHEEIGGDTWKTTPTNYEGHDGAYEYETPNNIVMVNQAAPKPTSSQYEYEIDGRNKYHIPLNPEIISSTKEWQGPTPAGSQYAYEIDRDSKYDTPFSPGIISSTKEWQSPTPAGSQYGYEIDRSNEFDIPINYEVTTPSKDRPGPSQYSFEIDRDNHQIQTNDGLTLDYEENNPGGANNWSAYSINDSDNSAKFPISSMDDTSTFYNSPSIISTNNQIYHNSNSNEGGFKIDILDASDEPDGNNLAQKMGLGNATKQNQISYNTISSNENERINASDETVPKFKSSKSSSSSFVKASSQSSTKMTGNNIPIKLTSHMDNNTSKDMEDNSANCDILIDPEDDLMNF